MTTLKEVLERFEDKFVSHTVIGVPSNFYTKRVLAQVPDEIKQFIAEEFTKAMEEVIKDGSIVNCESDCYKCIYPIIDRKNEFLGRE